jgi:hypothetical protein
MLFGSGPAHAIRHAVQHRYTVFCSHTPVPILILNHNLCMTLRTMSLVDVINMTFNFAGVDNKHLFKAVQAKGKELEQLLKPIFAYDTSVFLSSHVSIFLQGAWLALLCAGDLPFSQ